MQNSSGKLYFQTASQVGCQNSLLCFVYHIPVFSCFVSSIICALFCCACFVCSLENGFGHWILWCSWREANGVSRGHKNGISQACSSTPVSIFSPPTYFHLHIEHAQITFSIFNTEFLNCMCADFSPDKNPNGEEKFKRITQAYRILSDVQNRKD